MKISDEIRELAGKAGIYSNACVKLRELADRIDREMVELPKDKDGVPFNVGDTVYYCNSGFQLEVLSLSFDGQWHLTTNKAHVHDASFVAHERPDSWERIADDIEDFCVDNEIKGDHEVFDRVMDFAYRIRKLAEKEGER